MFPDRINRLIVDGVVDAYDYRETLWLDNLVDTERSLDLFHYHCARVGHPKCALANSTGDTTPEGVKDRVNNITTSLWHNPLPIISRQQPEIVTYSDVKGLLFMSLYSPIPMFPIAASILEGIERGVSHINEAPNLLAKAAEFGVQGPQMAIACSDGESQNGVSKEEFRSHVENLEKLSPNLGEVRELPHLCLILIPQLTETLFHTRFGLLSGSNASTTKSVPTTVSRQTGQATPPTPSWKSVTPQTPSHQVATPKRWRRASRARWL